jgi:hypothetical protein
VSEELCHCGQPVHYTDPAARRFVELMIETCGPTVRVTVEGRTFLVPRHYLALHGLEGSDVPSLGFSEVKS